MSDLQAACHVVAVIVSVDPFAVYGLPGSKRTDEAPRARTADAESTARQKFSFSFNFPPHRNCNSSQIVVFTAAENSQIVYIFYYTTEFRFMTMVFSLQLVVNVWQNYKLFKKKVRIKLYDESDRFKCSFVVPIL